MTDLPPENLESNLANLENLTTPNDPIYRQYAAEENVAPPTPNFEDWSLAHVLGSLLRAPSWTLSMVNATLRPKARATFAPSVSGAADLTSDSAMAQAARFAAQRAAPPVIRRQITLPTIDTRTLIVMAAVGGLFAIGLIGAIMLAGQRTLDVTKTFPLGLMLMIVSGIGMAVLAFIEFGFERLPILPHVESPSSILTDRSLSLPNRASLFFTAYGVRIALAGIGLLFSAGAWVFNSESLGNGQTGYNTFTPIGTFCWIMSVLAWVGALYERSSESERTFADAIFWRMLWPLAAVRSLFTWAVGLIGRTFRVKISLTLLAMIVILAAGAWFRFSNLTAYPPDMTSDHVEKALDANRVYNGLRPIFFPNNGGREIFQMYYLAGLRTITGWPISFDLLKLGTGLEGMLAIVLAWVVGRVVIGDEDRDLGNLTGLIMAALIATSYWHTMLSRLGLRIVTTTIIVMLILIFFAQAMRYNRRRDFLLTGLILGAGMYFYQAVRMVPVMIVAGIILAILVRARSWRALREYIVNSVALAIVALTVFVPLGHYWYAYPDSFWQRTGGRLFGDDQVEIKDSNGVVTGTRSANNSDRLKALADHLPVLGQNMSRSLAMFSWEGDRTFITGTPNGAPELDTVTSALFILGLGIILARLFRRRDPVDWLLPISILIMLLPTALSIAFIIEVPSATRASGSLPMVYLVAALALAVILRTLARRVPSEAFRFALYGVAIGFIVLGALSNADTYFVNAMSNYRDSSPGPYRQAGDILKGFRDSVGAGGNAIMIGYPYWWDARAIGIESGDATWNNGVDHHPGDALDRQIIGLMQQNNGGPYELRPDRQLMFFVDQADQESMIALQTMFPDGIKTLIKSFKPQQDFYIFTVAPVGCDWIRDKIGQNTTYCKVTDATPSALDLLQPTPSAN